MVFKSNYLPGNYYCLGGSSNGLKNDLGHDENTLSLVTNNESSSNPKASF